MKVLHISNVCNLSGWSKQAENHILALDAVGIDVAARHINLLNNQNDNLPTRVKELLRKDCTNPDIIILNTLPSLYERSGRAKTVGYYVVETNNFRSTEWASRINLLNAGLVPCYHNKLASIDSGVTVPLHIVPEAVDTSWYTKDYTVHSVRENLKDKFIFLTIGEFTVRKNIEATVRAFHLEFSPSEPVELVIKTTPVGMSNPQVEINQRLDNIKQGLKLYNEVSRYKKENVICGFLGEAEMGSLYKSVDAYVSSSRAEAFCIPVVDAMGFGKVVVSPDHTGLDYINDRNAYVVKTHEQSCFGALDTLPELYTGAEQWHEVSIFQLRLAMRQAFEHRANNLKKTQQARKDVEKFSLTNVGKLYKYVLEKLL